MGFKVFPDGRLSIFQVMVCEPRIIYLAFKGGFKVLFCFVCVDVDC